TLSASAFSDPDGDTHAASQWQVLDAGGASVVWDSGEDSINKINLSVPSGQLGYATSFRWQVRYKDSRGLWSGYSAQTSFTTPTAPNAPPLTPVNVSPTNGTIGASLTPTLSASA